MHLDLITPLVLTWNEEPNLRRCLERLRWAREVIILDSGSHAPLPILNLDPRALVPSKTP